MKLQDINSLCVCSWFVKEFRDKKLGRFNAVITVQARNWDIKKFELPTKHDWFNPTDHMWTATRVKLKENHGRHFRSHRKLFELKLPIPHVEIWLKHSLRTKMIYSTWVWQGSWEPCQESNSCTIFHERSAFVTRFKSWLFSTWSQFATASITQKITSKSNSRVRYFIIRAAGIDWIENSFSF